MWEAGVLLGALICLVLCVLFDLTDGGVHRFFVHRPVVASMIPGLLIAPPLAIVIERLLSRRDEARAQRFRLMEIQRWHQPAIDALDAYTYGADAVSRDIDVALKTLDHKRREAGQYDPQHGGYPYGVLHWLVFTDQSWFEEWASDLRSALSQTGLLAVSVGQTLALYAPLADELRAISKIERTLKNLATAAHQLAGTAWKDEVSLSETMERIASAMSQRTAEIITLQSKITWEKRQLSYDRTRGT
jgi:hypothetical protein